MSELEYELKIEELLDDAINNLSQKDFDKLLDGIEIMLANIRS